MASIANRMEARSRHAPPRRRTEHIARRRGRPGGYLRPRRFADRARIETATRLVIGDFVSIGLGGVGAVRAIVVWARDDQYGLDFVIPLTDEDAERAFGAGTVVRLMAPARRTETSPRLSEVESQDEEAAIGVYAEATGWLSVLLFTLIAGTVLAVALIRNGLL